MVGLGFDPFLAAVLCLIANTSPVAYGGLGTPLITLNGVTDLPTETLSIMAGHQLPLMSLFMPLYMVKVHVLAGGRRCEVWPALLVAGGSFALFQFIFATIHAYFPDVVLYPMTDIGGGIFSLVVTAIFLQFWKPQQGMALRQDADAVRPRAAAAKPVPRDPHAAEAAALLGPPPIRPPATRTAVDPGSVSLAWTPYAIMSVLLLLTGLVRQAGAERPSARRTAADQLHDPGPGAATTNRTAIRILHPVQMSSRPR